MRKRINLLLLIASISLLACSFVVPDDDKENLLLQIEGSPAFDRFTRGTYRVILIHQNSAVDTVILPVAHSFEYLLTKDAIYAIRIEKDGYLPRLISINTQVPSARHEGALYSFLFRVSMFRMELAAHLEPDDVDFPVAVIAYDQLSDRFEYGRVYTQGLLQRLEDVRSAKLATR